MKKLYICKKNTIIMEKETNIVSTKVYKPVELVAKNAPFGSYAAGCRATYGDDEDCYICDYGG